MRAVLARLAMAIALGLIAGCGGDGSGEPGAPAVVSENGCLSCHRLGEAGAVGPGHDLSRIGARLSEAEISRTLVDPPSGMPSFEELREKDPQEFDELVHYLGSRR